MIYDYDDYLVEIRCNGCEFDFVFSKSGQSNIISKSVLTGR